MPSSWFFENGWEDSFRVVQWDHRGAGKKVAETTGNTAAIDELKSLAPCPAADGSVTLDEILKERKWSVALGGLAYCRQSFGPYTNLVELSPEYDASDIEASDKGGAFSLGRLLPELNQFDFTGITDFRCPVVLIEGRHDTTSPSEIAAAWLEKVHAPAKKIIWLENSAHMTMFEEPGRFLVTLGSRPTAVRKLLQVALILSGLSPP